MSGLKAEIRWSPEPNIFYMMDVWSWTYWLLIDCSQQQTEKDFFRFFSHPKFFNNNNNNFIYPRYYFTIKIEYLQKRLSDLPIGRAHANI